MLDRGRALPAVLAEVHTSGFFVDHDGHDFEPYDEFLSLDETVEWWRSWTGDTTAEVAPLQVFGQDGTGGLAAFWIRDPDAAIDSQPVVFLGSEGELLVIARNLGDYVWLLANGVGPLETVDGIDRTPEPIPNIVTVARRYAGASEKPVAAVITAAQAELHTLTAFIDAAVQ